MRLLAHNLIVFLLLALLSLFFSQKAFAETTSYRSAAIVTADGATSFTNLSNCSATDGLTCNRALGNSYGNLYFRDFGTYADFGMPSGSKITQVKIRVTGKASTPIFVGVSAGTTFTENCQWPSDLWGLFLSSQTISAQNFSTPVIDAFQPGAVRSYCFAQNLFDTKKFIWRINYSSGQPWSASIDNFEIAFDYTPQITPTPTPSPTATPTPTPAKTPLILIPGIAGSELKTAEDIYWVDKNDGHGGKYNHAYPKDEVIWLNESKAGDLGNDDYFDVLRMKSDGINSEANIALTGDIVPLVYQKEIDFFVSYGYEINKDLFVFPYDWRRDVTYTSSLLDQKIAAIKQQTNAQKVDIVAHSMGGLVARNYIVDVARANNVRRLFTLGTPHLGSVNALKTLRYGDCLTKPELKISPVCFGVTNSETKDVVQNMISNYELAPSQKYFDFYSGTDNDHPYPYKTGSGALNYNQIKNYLTNLNYNTALFNPSEAFHSIDSLLPNTNGVDLTVIAGSGKPTLGQIIEDEATSLDGTKKPHNDLININGDGTVPLFSASLSDPKNNKSLLGDAKNARVLYTNQEHGELVTNGSALNLVKNILAGNNQLPTGVSTTPYSLSQGTLYSVHSPVNINIYDSIGNHTGPTDNGFETNIPGSTYETLGDAKFIYIPDDGNYTIKFVATDNGSFDFKIRKFENDTVSQVTLYKDIPLTTATTAETQVDTTSSTPAVVHLDDDGNGIAEQDVTATSQLSGGAVFDTTTPHTDAQVTGTLGNNGWYKSDVNVTLFATDEASGSGINKIEYSTDNGQTINTYTEPFTIAQEEINKLKFRAIDNAGNEENPQEKEIKIDKTPPKVSVYANPKFVWPPNGKTIDIKITGSSIDINLYTTKITVEDEYHLIEPTIAGFDQIIKLQASRNADDMDGRKYIIKAIAKDLAGNTSQTLVEVIVPHDQRDGK